MASSALRRSLRLSGLLRLLRLLRLCSLPSCSQSRMQRQTRMCASKAGIAARVSRNTNAQQLSALAIRGALRSLRGA
jgi:hypothetical protein